MNRRTCFAMGLCWLVLCMHAPALVPNLGGADVSVAVFSTHMVSSLTVAPAGDAAWIADCATCRHTPLTVPLHFKAPVEAYAGGSVRVRDDGSGEERVATGLWHLRSRRSSAGFDVVLTLPSERYVEDVVAAEAAADEPAQSLAALAILARTYALNGSHFTAQPGHLAADLCDSTACQAMHFGPVPAAIKKATQATAGETIWFAARRAQVFFSQNCGGLTEDAGAVWPGLRSVSYLRSHRDPYCVRRDRAAWHTEVSLGEFAGIARAEGWRLPPQIVAARVMQRSASHRALRIAVAGAEGGSAVIEASALRFGIGRALGWNRVRSDAYELALRHGALVFDGKGHGHGVGLCQQGAAEMATEGKSAREILAFYFPGTQVRILAADHGWMEARVGPIDVRSTAAVSDGRTEVLQRLWIEAQKLFPPQRAMAPEITFAPTSELFRQLTTEPGWALASTRGRSIVVQPEAVLRAHGRSEAQTLLHEMLHVLVEAESGNRAPVWLREGLVEVLAGDAGAADASMPAGAIDKALGNASSWRENERAHHAAAARVHRLIDRYGISAVRGWLVKGVPAGAMDS